MAVNGLDCDTVNLLNQPVTVKPLKEPVSPTLRVAVWNVVRAAERPVLASRAWGRERLALETPHQAWARHLGICSLLTLTPKGVVSGEQS